MADQYPGPNVKAMLAQINATVNQHVGEIAKSTLAGLRAGDIAAQSLAPSVSWAAKAFAGNFEWVADLGRVWSRAAEQALAEFRGSLPPNLRDAEDVDFLPLITLADEGITLWAVPRARVADRLLRAPTPQARRRVLGSAFDEILEDCAGVAAAGAAGPFPDLARLVEQAVRVTRSGEFAAGQALAASVLDTLMREAIEDGDRKRLVAHKRSERSQVTPMDHFDDLELAWAMVLRPMWFAYRPQETAEQRAVSTTFARHGTAHNIRGRQVSKRNAAQAVMLAAALLDLLSLERP